MSSFTVRQSIEAMEEYAVESVAADIIVNANESNYPLPQEIAEKITQRTARFPFNRYPPIKSENLCEVIAKELDVDIDCVKIGNGSSELLEKACYVFGGPGKKIAVPWPSFSMYGEYAALSDSAEVRYPLTAEGFVDADSVIAFCKEQQPSLLIVCNPNNPTGNYNSLAAMEKILANVDCPVIMDEAYMEFADGKELAPNDLRPMHKLWLVAGSTLSLVGRYSNLMVFRTFSKAYGLAGLRCGYAVGALGLVRQLGKALLPYHVNAFTLMAAKTVYENKELYKERIKTIREERDKFADCLNALGFKVWPTATNFVTFRAEGELMQQFAKAYAAKFSERLSEQAAGGKLIFKYLLANSILVRDFSTHPVLQGCLRITIGLPEENKQIIAKITELCAEVKA
ncbi:pyridoxal phosphate-dependent aminotransferase [Phascolarctobacterium succinatutens]|uniref:pyridoxal phosphate-dependent aminotransferase n=1 Tax=Phascolarctobacterium succinatutens TaxID=626940 RepID=UPI0026EC5FDB|nr:aminotransferase class I/II-fold pyridoxal phosphate-dependent enzyme [Phascolarctobacterium succinatutens]